VDFAAVKVAQDLSGSSRRHWAHGFVTGTAGTAGGLRRR
jgi:hypothetical protein